MAELILIDGNSLINRAFYSMPVLSIDGVYTNAVYGFINMLVKLINDYKPKYIATAFDLKDKTFRHEIYGEYKANRKGMPDELASQLPILKEVLNCMNIKTFECRGLEADDIIGTISKRYDVKTSILTADRDMLQLIDRNINVLLTKKGITEILEVDEKVLLDEFGLEPEQVIDYKALLGDASDNIPGVLGIGEKTALSLIQKYKSLDNVYKSLDEITGKQRENLISGKDSAYLSQKLAAIETNSDICKEVNIDDLRYDYPFNEKTFDIFNKYKFKSILAKQDLFKVEKKSLNTFNKAEILAIENAERLNGLVKDIKTKPEISIVLSLTKINLSFNSDIEYVINISDTFFPDVLNIFNALDILKPILQDGKIKKTVFDVKAVQYFLKPYNILLNGILDDICIMKYLTGETGRDNLNDLIFEEDLDLNALASGLFQLKKIYSELLKNLNALELYNIELTLSKILFDMEQEGFKIDKEVLNEFSQKYRKILDSLTDEIYALAGEQFNINSPKQLAHILFDKLSLDSGKKTKGKTGLSTDIEVLENLLGEHRIIEKIIRYRQIFKLYATYIEGLRTVAEKETFLVHTVFKQTLTSTGRISSTEPNLQNIPIRDEEGREIRKLFIPRSKDRILIAADYSQIELRLLAHLSNDEKLISAFNSGIDIHTLTASEVFGVPVENVDKNMRRAAKAVNFGIIYGISDFGLSKQLQIPVALAKSYIKKFFETYTGVKEFMDNCIQFSKKTGYAKTMFNRIRNIKDINSNNYNLRSFSERVAMNMPLQGSAADILKIAMVNVFEKLKNSNLKSKLILTVHDELIIDAFKNEAEKVELILKDCMENAAKLSVPLTVNIEKGESWYDAK